MDEIRVIDMNGRFRQDYLLWCANHKEIAADEDKMDEIFADMVEKWFDMPKKWLGGKTPNEYFEDIGDAQMYVTLLIEYKKADVDCPDALIKCITDRGEETYPLLLNIIHANESEDMTAAQLEDIQAACIALVEEMGEPHPSDRYIELLRDRTEESDLLDAIAAVMETEQDKALLGKLKDAYLVSSGAGKEVLLEIMSYFYRDDGVYAILACEFEEGGADKASLARCFGRLGDERAIPMLEKELKSEELDYYLYRSLREAIEELGGDEVEDREFYEDRDYDAVAAAGRDGDES